MSVSEARAHVRYPTVLAALDQAGFDVSHLAYRDDDGATALAELARADAVLVWVDPLSVGRTREDLDDLLRLVAAAGTIVFTHPDTILKMGTKDVLYDTRSLTWSLDTHRYESFDDLVGELPSRLAASGARVLKQRRGNGGNGVWKVELIGAEGTPTVRVQHAAPRDGTSEEISLDQLFERMRPYFDGEGHVIDQAFATRVREGMVRAYLVKGEVVGFARQYADRTEPGRDEVAPERVFGIPAAKTMRDADDPEFADLRRRLEREWVPGLQALVDVTDAQLPLLWDCDFLFGPRTDDAEESFVLCEVNVSCVSPFPATAPERVAVALGRELERRR